MSDLDIFLNAFDDSAPSGVELRNEPAFHALTRQIEAGSRAARTDADGTISLSPDVDWQAVYDGAVELAAKGRDLRLMVIVARAMLNQQGFAGLAAGLELLASSLDQYWDNIHPELKDNPDPGAASLRRKNALLQIENDENGILGDIEMMAVLDPRGIGPVRGEELYFASQSEFEFLSNASGGMSNAEEADLKARHAEIVGRATAASRALAAEDPDGATTLLADIRAVDAAREKLEQTFVEKAGLSNGAGCRFPELARQLAGCMAMLEAARADDHVATAEPLAEAASDPNPAVGGGGQGGSPTSAMPSAVNSRKDVEKCLDQIIAFYERTEPSSPIPHLARRMRRMVPMDFLQLMEEIAPSGMKEFRNVAGVDGKGK